MKKRNTKREVLTKSIYRDGLLHHRYRFGFIGNVRVWFCRTFGHRINNRADHKWCERCDMYYGEIYHKQEGHEKHI